MIETIEKNIKRKLPVGAEVLNGGVHFRVWADKIKNVKVVIEENSDRREFDLVSEDNGYHSAFISEASEGMNYYFRLDDDEKFYPDPASRFQPFGPHGPSQIVNPDKFEWRDSEWKGISIRGQIIYELHIGTFTHEGTWKSAAAQLNKLAELGITVIEIMPIADFSGKFGWGYDGVNLFAPTRLYGSPDDARNFINEAHLNGIGVILDVVYNHLGPDGNYLTAFSDHYLTKKHRTDWGEAVNFDGDFSKMVREFYISNAVYWIDEFHFDGFRFDATQDIYDESSVHILSEINEAALKAAHGRSIITIAENEPQQINLILPNEKGGIGLNGIWNDDFHHSATVALTGRKEAYYTDYSGKPQEFVSAAKYSFLFQGQHYLWQKKRRGTSTRGIKQEKFVHFIQNHDQVANSGRGYYIHKQTSPGKFKALSSLTLLGPQTPMIFQGQEFAASNSFFYFADHKKDLAELVHRGRTEFLAQFRSLALPETQAKIPDPSDELTFFHSKIDLSEREKNSEIYNMYKDLIHLRKTDETIKLQGVGGIDGAVLDGSAFVIRFFSDNGLKDRLLIINLGVDLNFNPAPEPLLAPPYQHSWEILFSTEDFKYGGIGTAELETKDNWKIPGNAAVLLKPVIVVKED